MAEEEPEIESIMIKRHRNVDELQMRLVLPKTGILKNPGTTKTTGRTTFDVNLTYRNTQHSRLNNDGTHGWTTNVSEDGSKREIGPYD